MSCQRWKAILFDLARGLDSVNTDHARAHLRECSSCRDELNEQQQLTEQLQYLAAERDQQTSEKVPSDLLNAFRKMNQPKKRRILVWMRAAVLVVAILGCWIWYRSLSSDHHADNDPEYTFEEFIPLQYANPAVNSRQVVRVKLESSALQDLGFPRVPEWDHRRIEADIIVGDDGLPQAIRFVNLSQ
ncbi:MAG TPA: hypothetical protein VLH08_02280 [Acidobacteriota bacterium]|nr:hypothetical protein [Acidobacteriota bacterium]